MEPTLRDGDWIVVVPLRRLPRVGAVVLVRDPLDRGRLLVKRVSAVREGQVRLRTDSPAHAAHFTEREVAAADVLGTAALRYWPPRRIGRVR